MAKTVLQAFEEFMQRYEPTSVQKEAASRHQNYLREVLENKIDITEDFLTGSYIKQTQIKPPTDIDVFVVLDPKYRRTYWPRKASEFLKDFHQLLKQTYSSSKIKPDGQAVKIEFADSFKMDAVPAFEIGRIGYTIPNANNNSWIRTKPREYDVLLSNANQTLDGKLKPLIKMVKCWNSTWGNILRSLHIEVLVLKVFCNLNLRQCYPFGSYTEGLEKFFNKARTLVSNPVYEPIVKDRVDKYLNNIIKIKGRSYLKRTVIKHFLNKHYLKIRKALFYQRRDYHKEAIEIWKQIFNDYFPSYY